MNAPAKLITLITSANLIAAASDYPNVYTFCKISGLVEISYWDVYTQSRQCDPIGYDDAQVSYEGLIVSDALAKALRDAANALDAAKVAQP